MTLITNNVSLLKMPKVELHLHFEGSFPLVALKKLAGKYDKQTSQLEFIKKFHVKDFNSFIQAWEYKNSLLKNQDDLKFVTDTLIDYLKRENIVYVELTISPFGLKNLNPYETIETLHDKLTKSDIAFALIGDVVRNTDIQKIRKKYDFYKEMRRYNIVGIGLGGMEEKCPAILLSSIFRQAKSDNFHVAIHAGEFGNERNIEDSITYCFAERIGHGNDITNKELIENILQKGIHIEMCPYSNYILNRNYTPQNYKLKDYLSKGMSISINSDDPGMFNKSLTDTLLYAANTYNLSLEEIQKMNLDALDHSFTSEENKKILYRRITTHHNYRELSHQRTR